MVITDAAVAAAHEALQSQRRGETRDTSA